MQVKLSIIRAFALESSSQKTYFIQSFLNQYNKRSHSIQTRVKEEIVDQFNYLLEAKIESQLDFLLKGQKKNSGELQIIGEELRRGFIGLALRNEDLLNFN